MSRMYPELSGSDAYSVLYMDNPNSAMYEKVKFLVSQKAEEPVVVSLTQSERITKFVRENPMPVELVSAITGGSSTSDLAAIIGRHPASPNLTLRSLFFAARSGNVQAMKNLIELHKIKELNINYCGYNQFSHTPLLITAIIGDGTSPEGARPAVGGDSSTPEGIKLLLDAGVDVCAEWQKFNPVEYAKHLHRDYAQVIEDARLGRNSEMRRQKEDIDEMYRQCAAAWRL